MYRTGSASLRAIGSYPPLAPHGITPFRDCAPSHEAAVAPPPQGSLAATSQSRCRLPSMDKDGFDAWGSQPSLNDHGIADLDLNSQAPTAEGFPGLGLYRTDLQGDADELLPGRVRGSSLPPYRPPPARPEDVWANPAAPYTRKLNFGRRPHNNWPHQIQLGKSQMIGKAHLWGCLGLLHYHFCSSAPTP